MGEPYYQIKQKLTKHGIVAFSSNYALYGDMSERVMTVIESLVPQVEIYCTDEAFADLSGVPGDLEQLGRQIRAQVYRSTGIPVGVGIAGTKTLSKLANHAAKKWQAQSGGVVDLRDQVKREWVLKKCPASDVWGVGRKMTAHLEGMGIKSAWELSKADPWTSRKRFSVVIEKTARELAGTPCLELDEPDPPKAGDLLQPDVWQVPDGYGAHQGGGGDLHGARHRKVAGAAVSVQEAPGEHSYRFFQPR